MALKRCDVQQLIEDLLRTLSIESEFLRNTVLLFPLASPCGEF